MLRIIDNSRKIPRDPYGKPRGKPLKVQETPQNPIGFPSDEVTLSSQVKGKDDENLVATYWG